MDNGLVVVGVGLLVLIAVFLFLGMGTRPRCAECGSREIGIQKTITGFRSNASGEGGDVRIQMQYNIKYRCNDCQTQWTVTTTETR